MYHPQAHIGTHYTDSRHIYRTENFEDGRRYFPAGKFMAHPFAHHVALISTNHNVPSTIGGNYLDYDVGVYYISHWERSLSLLYQH